MPSSAFRLLPCFAVLAAIAGCGGASNTGSSGGGSSGGGGNASPTVVTFSFLGNVAPAAVATQIGTGAYTPATPISGKVTLSIPNGQTNFSVAYACPPVVQSTFTSNEVNITEATTLDGTKFTGNCFGASSGSTPATGIATAQVNAAAIPGGDTVSIGQQSLPWSSSILDFSGMLTLGTYDIPVTVSANSTGLPAYLAVKVLRSQTVPGALNGGAPIVFQTSDETVPQALTYNNIPAGFALENMNVTYQTADGLGIGYLTSTPDQYLAIPSSTFQAGDYYTFDTFASNATYIQNVNVTKITPSNGPQSFTFPAPWSYAGPTPAALPTLDFAYTGFSGMPNVEAQASIAWSLGNSTNGYVFDGIAISATPNYLNGATSVTIPDLSAMTGFLAPAPSGTPINWFATMAQSSFTATKPPSGTSQAVSASGNYNVP